MSHCFLRSVWFYTCHVMVCLLGRCLLLRLSHSVTADCAVRRAAGRHATQLGLSQCILAKCGLQTHCNIDQGKLGFPKLEGNRGKQQQEGQSGEQLLGKSDINNQIWGQMWSSNSALQAVSNSTQGTQEVCACSMLLPMSTQADCSFQCPNRQTAASLQLHVKLQDTNRLRPHSVQRSSEVSNRLPEVGDSLPEISDSQHSAIAQHEGQPCGREAGRQVYVEPCISINHTFTHSIGTTIKLIDYQSRSISH